MDAIKQWKQDNVIFLMKVLEKIDQLSKRADRDKKIMHFLFSLYLNSQRDGMLERCEYIREFIDKYSFYGLRILKSEIKQSIAEFRA